MGQNAKKTQTVRQRAEESRTPGPRRIRKTASRAKAPLFWISKFARKLRLPIPNNKPGRLLRKIARIIGLILLPKFFRGAWREVRLVTWPNRHDTIHLTIAVLIFAVIFAVIVGILDFGLDKLFKEVILNIK